MLLVWQQYSKWSHDKGIKCRDVDWDLTSQCTSECYSSLVWESLPKIPWICCRQWAYTVVEVQLAHWKLCLKNIKAELKRKKKVIFNFYSYCHSGEFSGLSVITEGVARKGWWSGSPFHFQSHTSRQQRNCVLQYSFIGVITKDMQSYEERWVKKTTVPMPTSVPAVTSLGYPNTSQHAPSDSFHLSSARKETHGDRTTHGCSAGHKTAWCSLEKVSDSNNTAGFALWQPRTICPSSFSYIVLAAKHWKMLLIELFQEIPGTGEADMPCETGWRACSPPRAISPFSPSCTIWGNCAGSLAPTLFTAETRNL